ncbi:hypothetical protein ACOSQ2_032876 [Xanthoceras sorbifolium]
MTGLGSSCGACKFLRRRCASDCIFAPYFSHEQASTHFAAVHKVFGASNVSKLLLHLPVERRGDAAITISYEALARMRDPVYGCVAHIFALQQQVANLQEEIEFLENHIANHMIGFSNNGIISPTMSNDHHHHHLPCNDHHQSYFSPHNDVMNTIYCQQQQQQQQQRQEEAASPGLVVNNSPAGNCTNVNVNVSQQAAALLDPQINLQVSSSQGWQDQNSAFESSLNHVLGLLEGEDQDILSCYPWLDIGNVTNSATI